MPNYSAFCDPVSALITPIPPSNTAIRMHRGFGMRLVPPAVGGIGGRRFDLAVHEQYIKDTIYSLHNEPGVRLFQIEGFWKALEGDVAGNYATGYAALQRILDFAQLYGKYISLFMLYGFHGNRASLSDIFPLYLINGSQYGIDERGSYGLAGGGGYARVWQPSTQDRFDAVINFYSPLNSHPALEMLAFCESSTNIPVGAGSQNGQPGFSGDRMVSFFSHTHTYARTKFPNVNIRFGANDMPNVSQMGQAIADCITPACAIGGPDVWLGDVTWADGIYRGFNPALVPSAQDGTYPDRIISGTPQVPWVSEVQTQSFGRYTARQLHDAVCFGYTPENGAPAQPAVMPYWMFYEYESHWESDTLPFIRANYLTTPMVSRPKPSSYAAWVEG